MTACKERLGLAAAPTPTSTALYDTATGPHDPAIVRIKTLCGAELHELLEARRAVNDLRAAPPKGP